jgi:glucokinase
MALLAVDIGGTKIAQALVTRDGLFAARAEQPTDHSGPQAVIAQIAAFAQEHTLDAAAVSIPAVLELGTDRVLWAPNLPGWREVPLRELLRERLGCPVFVEYDGHAAVLGEWWAGAAKGCSSVVSVIIGTGIGGGVIVDNRLWRGRDRLAGAVGWSPITGPDGLDHWENLAAGPGIAQQARRLLHQGVASTLAADTLTARDVFDAARAGDALAAQVVNQAATLIGQGVSGLISFVNPHIVVLGGSVGQQGDLLLPGVRAAVGRWTQPVSGRAVPIVSSALGANANLLGVAYTAFSTLTSGEANT